MIRESVVFCEGFHDRAFWSGMLRHLGCTDPGIKSGKSQRSIVRDPWGKPVANGQFGFNSKADGFIRVVPCGGKSKVVPKARLRSEGSVVEALRRLVVCRDSDEIKDEEASEGTIGRAGAIARGLDATAVPTASGDFRVDTKDFVISVVHWETATVHRHGLPSKQTLERIVCAAITAAYPDRGGLVQSWIDSIKPVVPTDGKAYVWSYMAGWHPDYGCEAFFRELWNDKNIVEPLAALLKDSDTWRIANALTDE